MLIGTNHIADHKATTTYQHYTVLQWGKTVGSCSLILSDNIDMVAESTIYSYQSHPHCATTSDPPPSHLHTMILLCQVNSENHPCRGDKNCCSSSATNTHCVCKLRWGMVCCAGRLLGSNWEWVGLNSNSCVYIMCRLLLSNTWSNQISYHCAILNLFMFSKLWHLEQRSVVWHLKWNLVCSVISKVSMSQRFQ